MPDFKLNEKRIETVTVGDSQAITFLGPEGPRVLSTPKMIGFMERTCRDLVFDMLDTGFDTVGTHVNVYHKSAAAMGSTVVFTAELAEIIYSDKNQSDKNQSDKNQSDKNQSDKNQDEKAQPRRVEFRVTAMQDDKVIGEGTHQRAIVNVRRFKEKVTG